MTRIVAWPGLDFMDCIPHFVAPESALNTSLNGRTSAVGTIPGYFEFKCTWVMRDHRQFMAYEAFIADLEGSANIFHMPVVTRDEQPQAVANGYTDNAAVEVFSDGRRFDDGTSFGVTAPAAYFTEDLAIGTASGNVNLPSGSVLKPGARFEAFTYHHVTRLLDRGNGSYKIYFKPPLPRAHAKTRPINFSSPCAWVRLKEKGDARIENSGMRFLATVDVTVVEAEPVTVERATGLKL